MKKLHLGTSAGGVEHRVYIDGDANSARIISEDYQSDAVTDAIKDQVKRERGQLRTSDGLRKVASIPITLYQDWRNQWMGKGKYAVQRGDPPCKSVHWNTYLEIKASHYEMAELHTTQISQGGKW